MLFCARRIFKCQLYFCASHSPSLFDTLLLHPSSSCSLVGQAKPCNAEPSSVQTDEIAWEHRREIGSIAEASQFMEVAFYLWCHSSCHLNHLPSIFLCTPPPFSSFNSPNLFPSPSSLGEGWAIWGKENSKEREEGVRPRVVRLNGGWAAKYRAALEEWCHGLAERWRAAWISRTEFRLCGRRRRQNHRG